MSDDIYTLGVWRVKEGKQDQFVEAWKRLGRVFHNLPHPPGEGTLVQSLDEPQQFYSFGPWRTLDDVLAMRSDPDARREIGTLMELCDVARPGTFRVVATG
jgi:hypothetical protein